MTRGNAIRCQGKIATWKDDQGFGFIAPNGGGPLVFVHIKSFANRSNRPSGDDAVTYELTVNDKGQPRAESVAFVHGRGMPSPSPSSSNQASATFLLAAVGFFGAVATLVLVGKLPLVVLWVYLGASVVTFITYAVDKWAARNDRWRTKESTLHVLALAGGWPGALVAQQILRHKSKKQSFQTAFWFTVAVNCAALGWLLSTSGAGFLLRILDEIN